MSERFPDIDRWCDHCGAYLNDQDGSDDDNYTHKCTELDIRTASPEIIFMIHMRIIGIPIQMID